MATDNIQQMIKNARIAQREWAMSSQKEIDDVVREIAKTVNRNAQELARLTVDETGMGNYEDNLCQDKRKSEIIWNSLKGKKSVGVINRDKKRGMVQIAKPIGVVGVMLPVTIPVTNFMANTMFSLKCGNAVIHAPHPRSKKTTARTSELVLKALENFNVPENLIQVISEPTGEIGKELMSAVDVVVATGGMGIVKAAYSSGTPAFGVGPGNVQCIVDRDVNISEVVPKVVLGRRFNNGLPCACEQTVIVPEELEDKYIAEFKKNKAVYIDDPEKIGKLADFLFDADGVMSRDGVGLNAFQVAEKIGLPVPADTEMVLVKGVEFGGKDDVLRREKLCPVALIYSYYNFDQAIEIALANLEIQGKGHSVAIHSNDDRHIQKVGLTMPVTKVIVNQCATTGVGGSYYNCFAPSTTLGCGFWGNNAITENLSYKHLMNITTIGYYLADAKIPTEEDLWAN